MPRMPGTLKRKVVGKSISRAQIKQSQRWYHTAHWQARRRGQLAIEPLCRMCRSAGVIKVASVADHIEPHREDAERFWHGELQSLCASCHSSAKQREETRRGKG